MPWPGCCDATIGSNPAARCPDWAWPPCSGWPRSGNTLMNDITASRDSWWLASLGNTLIWARLRVRPAGTAEVLDSDGNTLSYDSEDTARSQLFDAEFVEYDGLDEEDAQARGFTL